MDRVAGGGCVGGGDVFSPTLRCHGAFLNLCEGVYSVFIKGA